MSISALSILNVPGALPTIPEQNKRSVALSSKIEADSSRVLYALSIPEYIEAWLQAPNMADGRFVFNPLAGEAFRIDLYRGEALQACVHGSCRVVGNNQVRYLWKTTSPAGATDTLVDMRLRYASGGCLLGLTHRGFKDMAERAWCYIMWHQSLERLSRIMKKK